MYIIAMLNRKHTRKSPEDAAPGQRLSKYQMYADGEIEVLEVISGELPEMKKKPLAVDFSELEPQQYRYITKRTVMQLGGEIEELTKTQDIFRVTSLKIQSRSAAAALIQGIHQDPQTVRNELIINEQGDSLEESSISELTNNQDIQELHQILSELGYKFDLEVPYDVNAFFTRRAKHRNYESVPDMISQEPLTLSELAFRESSLSPGKLIQRIGGETDPGVRIYAKAASILQQRAQEGDAYLRPYYLYGYLHDDLAMLEDTNEPSPNTLLNLIAPDSPVAYLTRSLAKITLTKPAAKTLSPYRRQMQQYFFEKLKEEMPDSVDKARKISQQMVTMPQIYLKKSFFSERAAARNFANHLGVHQLQKCIQELNENMPDLDEEQIACIQNAFNSKISCIVGGAGTGKTRIISEIVKIMEHNHYKTLILAPSAKAALHAAAEAAEQLGKDNTLEYQTIHRAAKIVPEDEDMGEEGDMCVVNEEDFGKYAMIIIDEMSMCTLPVFNKILKAVAAHAHTHLVLVGDDQQLPAIGPQFFHQICDGLLNVCVPVIKLKKNHRANSDKLAKFAQDLREGELNIPESDNVQVIQDDVNEFIENHKDLVKDDDTLFLVSYREDCEKLNAKIRGFRLDMKTAERIGTTNFYVGDKVITTRNDYADNETDTAHPVTRHKERVIDVYNGTDGVIESFDKETNTVQIRLFAPGFPEEGKLVPYCAKEISLYYQPAYALTVHKAQGSQAKQVIFYINEKQKRGLSRNALYTAVTRAQDKLYILTSEDSLQYAVKQKAHYGTTCFAFRVLNELEHPKES